LLPFSLLVPSKDTGLGTDWILREYIYLYGVRGRLIMTAARERKESRALLKRSDYPEQDNENWFAFLGVSQDKDGRIHFSKKPIQRPE
jgi:succinate dehydrogenase/fumarate reductase flavoprotein subunit